jgi:hypothetical protein
MWVEERSEAVQERNRAELRLGPGIGTGPAQPGLERMQQHVTTSAISL